jgi:hypothetical protein
MAELTLGDCRRDVTPAAQQRRSRLDPKDE